MPGSFPEATPSPTAAAGGELGLFSFAWPHGRLRDVTEAFTCLLGVTRGEVNGRALLDLVSAADRAELSRSLTALASGLRRAPIECRFVQSDGHVVYVEWVARRIPGSDLWRAAGIDTADLVKLLADRRDLRTRLDLAIGQATATTWDLDLRADRFTWEPQAAEILGVSPQNIPHDAIELAPFSE